MIIREAKKKLRPYREQAAVVKGKVAAQYEKYLPEITKLYGKTTHWHGTGRFRYERDNDIWYDVLAKIVDLGGLYPFRDPWINSGGSTVSLATIRMLSRAFARVHSNENSTFVYELGSIKFWLRLYFFLTAVWLCTDRHALSTVFGGLFHGTFFRDIRSWESAIRKPNGKRVSVLNVFLRKTLVSDIEGNYPILIGIVADSKELIETTPIAHKVERRSLKPIMLTQCTHIEVPLQNVVETEKILRERGVSLPVLPLEFGDLYLSDQPLEKLAVGQK